jgi:hypothetical protein
MVIMQENEIKGILIGKQEVKLSLVFCLFVCLFYGTGAKHMLCSLSHTSVPFFSGYFGETVLGTICLGWPPTLIFLIAAFQVARITIVSHQLLATISVCRWHDLICRNPEESTKKFIMANKFSYVSGAQNQYTKII